MAVATVLALAGLVWAFAPTSWRSLIADEQGTDATVLTVVSIWSNNLLICCLPLLAGVYGHRLICGRRVWWARAVLVTAIVGAGRSLVVIGVVGGLDPRWLACAAAWWIAEVAVLGACCAAGWQAAHDADPDRASRRLAHVLALACAVLGIAAVVEVALT